jgi:hypothetical protein
VRCTPCLDAGWLCELHDGGVRQELAAGVTARFRTRMLLGMIWGQALPGREAAVRNELLRALHRLGARASGNRHERIPGGRRARPGHGRPPCAPLPMLSLLPFLCGTRLLRERGHARESDAAPRPLRPPHDVDPPGERPIRSAAIWALRWRSPRSSGRTGGVAHGPHLTAEQTCRRDHDSCYERGPA